MSKSTGTSSAARDLYTTNGGPMRTLATVVLSMLLASLIGNCNDQYNRTWKAPPPDDKPAQPAP